MSRDDISVSNGDFATEREQTVFKQISRIALAVLVTLAVGAGLTATAGAADAARIASATSSCASQQSAVAQAQHKVAKDKKQLKKAKRHHHKAAAKKARKHLKRDRRHLAAARSAYNACMNQSSPSPSPSPAPAPTPAPSNPVTDQCNAMAGQLTSQDPTGTFASGSAAFCDLLGQLAASSPSTDPVALCNQLAAQDPTGQFGQLCTALGGSSLPGLPTPGTSGGVIGSTLEGICDQIAAQDPSGQLQQLCTGLGSLPI
jgi:hypothetical protein